MLTRRHFAVGAGLLGLSACAPFEWLEIEQAEEMPDRGAGRRLASEPAGSMTQDVGRDRAAPSVPAPDPAPNGPGNAPEPEAVGSLDQSSEHDGFDVHGGTNAWQSPAADGSEADWGAPDYNDPERD